MRKFPLPVLHYIKSNPKYKDKCELQEDKLVVDGVKYTMENTGDLPHDIAAFKTVEKSNETSGRSRISLGGRGPIRGAWTSDTGAFHRKCMQKQKNWVP